MGRVAEQVLRAKSDIVDPGAGSPTPWTTSTSSSIGAEFELLFAVDTQSRLMS
jgi:hypothetical protein